jgi:hypothetical protein
VSPEWFRIPQQLAGTALFALALSPLTSAAQSAPTPTAAPATPAPSATPSGLSDPCTSILALVNRPTVATGSCVFKNGHGDVEFGYTNTLTTGSAGGSTVAYPQTFLRVGTLVHNVELEITPPSALRTSAGSPVSGTADAAFGAKWELGYTAKTIASINVAATVPTGDRAFTAGGSSYFASLNGSYTLNPVFTLSATAGLQNLAAPGANGTVQRTGVFAPALLLVAALPGSAQVYGEVSNVSHAGVGLPGRTLYDFGAQTQLGSRIVLDLETGFAPAPVAGAKLHYIGAGFTYGI